jgi:predicted transcriptional regulator
MKLRDFLEKYRIHPVEFAVRCGISPASIYLYLKGRKPNQRTAELIEKESDGVISVLELRGKDKRKKVVSP